MPKVNMSKEIIVCPFSGGVCRQCAIYRGRHFELCALHNTDLKKTRAAKAKAWTDPASTKWGIAEIPKDLEIQIVNVENLVEKRDL